MNKKTIIWLSAGVAAIILIVVISVVVNNNSNEAEKQTNDLKQEREDKADETKEQAKDDFGIEEDILTKEEIAEEITKYNRDEEEDLDEEEIADKLEEDFGEYTARAYRTGYMIDEDMDDEKKKVLLNELLGYGEPIEKIKSSIDGEFGNQSVDDEIKEIGDLYLPNEEGISYVGDTEGFYDIDGINVGYPVVRRMTAPDSDDPVVSIIGHILVDKDIKEKNVNKYLDKIKELEVNGFKVGEKDGLLPDDVEDLKKDEDRDVFIGENNILTFEMVLPYDEVFEKDDEIKTGQDLYEKIFQEDGERRIETKPKVSLNGDDIKVDKEMNYEELEKEGFILNPEIIGSK